jgi:starvation-inducible outer membrane lipoprotein
LTLSVPAGIKKNLAKGLDVCTSVSRSRLSQLSTLRWGGWIKSHAKKHAETRAVMMVLASTRDADPRSANSAPPPLIIAAPWGKSAILRETITDIGMIQSASIRPF